MIAAKFCTCHGSTAVVTCANFCSYLMARYWIYNETVFTSHLKFDRKLSVKWSWKQSTHHQCICPGLCQTAPYQHCLQNHSGDDRDKFIREIHLYILVTNPYQMHCRHHTHHEHYKSNSWFANIWTYYHKSTKFACKIVPVMNPRSRAPPASNVNKGIPGLLGLPLHVVDCYVNTGRRRQITMPALIKFPVCIRHHGGPGMGVPHEDALQAALNKFDLTLTLKEKQKEALDHILDHCLTRSVMWLFHYQLAMEKVWCIPHYPMFWERGGT